MAALARETCANHPDRPGTAVCIGCRKVVCRECSTQWEGIHYCAACLSRRREGERRRSGLVAWTLWGGAVAGLFVAATWLLVWAGVLLVGG